MAAEGRAVVVKVRVVAEMAEVAKEDVEMVVEDFYMRLPPQPTDDVHSGPAQHLATVAARVWTAVAEAARRVLRQPTRRSLVCICVCVCVHSCVYVCVVVCVREHECVYMCLYVCIYVCVFALQYRRAATARPTLLHA